MEVVPVFVLFGLALKVWLEIRSGHPESDHHRHLK